MSQKDIFNSQFNEDYKKGLAIYVPFVFLNVIMKKNTKKILWGLVITIPLPGHSFLISLYWDSCVLNDLHLAFQSDIYI